MTLPDGLRGEFFTGGRTGRAEVIEAALDSIARREGRYGVHGHAHGAPCDDWCHVLPAPEAPADPTTVTPTPL